ncbi:MAG: hypothetical protein IOC54_10655 [Methylobacterium sp.]|nr:hypothetical protein [Methylobacterium sp.]MCA3652287.1 hypothetical protein [Methylobacterium sp.]MCA4921949.1 hypothetical protein [Methylobacterium sp.]
MLHSNISPKASSPASSRIIADLDRALSDLMKQWVRAAGDTGLNERQATAQAIIEIALADYADLIRKVERTASGIVTRRVAYATAKLLDAPDAKIAAMVRSMAGREPICLPAEVLAKAATLSVWQPLTEAVRVFWLPKAAGKFRPIVAYGPIRKAQGLMVRDMLMVAGVDTSTNFAVKGAGGESGLVNRVCTLMNEGKNWWWTPDIKSAFSSMHRGHFGWLGLDRRLLLNVAYLPKCARIEAKLPEDTVALAAYLKDTYPDLPVDVPLKDITKLMVRRGLPQGSVLSPLLAGALVARMWGQTCCLPDAVVLSWHDDLHVGTETKAQLKLVKEQLTLSMASLPAGPIEFHESPILPASSQRVTVLGYLLQPGRGNSYLDDGSRSIHVKPGRKRIVRFRRRLADKLAAASDADARLVVAETYALQWFNAQTAWTKVPGHSLSNAQTCAITYLCEFENGQPMGGGWIG